MGTSTTRWWTAAIVTTACAIGCADIDDDTGKGGAPPTTSSFSSSDGGAGGTPATSGGSSSSGGAATTSSGTASMDPLENPSLFVEVRDAAGAPVPNAAITADDTTTAADGAGHLFLDNLAPGRFMARIEAWGFAPACFVANLEMGIHAGAEVRLSPLGDPILLDADLGGDVQLGSVRVTVPPGAFVDRNDEPATGPIEATIVAIDPASPSFALTPGPLVGQEAGGGMVDLESLAMAEVSFWKNGTRLQLAPGKTATLELALAPSIAAQYTVGDTVPAWWLDLDAGLWREEGTGTIQESAVQAGNLAWVAEVSHFSWWNADRSSEKSCLRVCVTASVTDDNPAGTPQVGVTVTATGTSYQGFTSGITGTSGCTCLEYKLCNDAYVYIGPYSITPPAGGELFHPPMPCQKISISCSPAGPNSICPLVTLLAAAPQLCDPGSQLGCPGYSGPSGTEGIGLCKPSRRYCAANGAEWHACTGEVTPAVESCNTPFDDDCDGLLNEEGQDCACQPGAAVDCYSGPAGTAGLGVCIAGQRTCAADGKDYGICSGQVLPQPEACGTPEDDDCDGAADCGGAHVWSKVFGTDSGRAYATGVDASGNVYVGGRFSGEADFGGGPLAAAGQYDAFLTKFDASGNHSWSKRFGTTAADILEGLAVDGNGDVCVVGSYWSSPIDLGNGPLPNEGNNDVFLAKFAADGTALWSKHFGGAGYEGTKGVAADNAGNCVLTMVSIGSSPDFGGGSITTGSNSSGYVAKFDKLGNHLWSKGFGGGQGTIAPYDVSLDGAGNIVFTGRISAPVDFGGGLLPSAGDYDIILVKLDSAGNHVWSKVFGGSAQDSGIAVATDSEDNILMTGWFGLTIDFGGGQFISAGKDDAFLVKFDPSGTSLWAKHYGDAGVQDGLAVAVDSSDNVILAGSFEGTLDFGGSGDYGAGSITATAGGWLDAFVAKLSPAGNTVWVHAFGSAAAAGDSAGGVAAGTDGRVVACGLFSGTVDFGGGPLEPLLPGGSSGFITEREP